MSTNVTPSWSALKRKDLRRSRRYTVDGATIRVAWLGLNGTLKVVQNARVLNISAEGMAFELPEPAQLVTRVKLQSDKHKLLGEGTVRHCRRVGSKYVVGVEFADGLRWRPPDDSVAEPVPLSDPG
jgi:PilZ domain-containing protein